MLPVWEGRDYAGQYTNKCKVCSLVLGHSCRVRCADCTEVVDLCIDCHRAGRVPAHSQHQRTHAYRVARNLNFPVFSHDWTAADELMLLDGLAKRNGLARLGIGNWDDNSMGLFQRSKTPQELRQHYYDVYFSHYGFVLPTH
ncbi:unnamed protein product, partial [Phaeothamnion confervicola]